jgi:hypothetical protein
MIIVSDVFDNMYARLATSRPRTKRERRNEACGHPRSQCLTSARCLGGVAEVRPCETGWLVASLRYVYANRKSIKPSGGG